VLVTHDPEIANRADRKIVLKDGMIIEDTLPSADFTDSLVPSERTNG
jgi:ABC-type lipoprotein export system ATPase subunit